MTISFDNESTKRYLAKYGRPAKVFGVNVDHREVMADVEAVTWFDDLWKNRLATAVQRARRCDIDFVREKVPHKSHAFINADCEHREFTLAGCMFTAQLPNATTCDQLSFIPSSGPDPRTIYVSFESVQIKSDFERMAQDLGWKPDELGEKLLLDFMESVTRKSYRSAKSLDDWGVSEFSEDDEG